MKLPLKVIEKISSFRGKGILVIGLVSILSIAAILGILALLGSALIFGLNLMGLEIPYTLGTISGSILVQLLLKPVSSKK
jgi:hypothetical protein